MNRSAFGVEDERVGDVSKAGVVGPLGTAIKDTVLAPVKGLKPLGQKVKDTVHLNAKTAWQVATPGQKLAAGGAGAAGLGFGLGRKSKD